MGGPHARHKGSSLGEVLGLVRLCEFLGQVALVPLERSCGCAGSCRYVPEWFAGKQGEFDGPPVQMIANSACSRHSLLRYYCAGSTARGTSLSQQVL